MLFFWLAHRTLELDATVHPGVVSLTNKLFSFSGMILSRGLGNIIIYLSVWTHWNDSSVQKVLSLVLEPSVGL